MGTITLDVTGTLNAGDTIPLTAVGNFQVNDGADPAAPATGVDGSIQIAGLTVSPNPHDFGTVLELSSNSQTFTVTNSGVAGRIILGTPFSGFTTGTDLAAAGSGATPCADGTSLTDGASCTFDVTWTPAAAGTLSDTVTVNSNSNNVSVPLSGTAVVNDAQLQVNNSPVSGTFPVGVGTVALGAFDISNTATAPVTESLAFSNCAFTAGSSSQITFTAGALALPTLNGLSIAPGGNDNTTAAFSCDTTAAGTYSATVVCDTTDNDNATGVTIGTLNCTVTNAVLDSTPAPGSTIALGQIQLGGSANAGIDVGNSAGTDALVITAITTTGPDVTISSMPTLPWTIPAGTAQDGTDDIIVQCAPSADGAISDTLTITSNDAGSPDTYTVTCEGVSTAVPSITPPGGGSVTVGPGVGTVTADIVVNNTGNDSFTIDTCSLDASLTAAPYNCTITSPAILPATVSAGGSQTITVECTLAQGDVLNVANGLNCDLTGDFDGDNGTPPTTQNTAWNVNLVGAVFVIPTLNGFGLLLLALSLLVAGGTLVRQRV